MWMIFFIIIIIDSGMTRRSYFPFQSVSETPFLPLLQEKNKKKATTKRKKHINYN